MQVYTLNRNKTGVDACIDYYLKDEAKGEEPAVFFVLATIFTTENTLKRFTKFTLQVYKSLRKFIVVYGLL